MSEVRILIVEDEGIVALDLKGRLTSLGYCVVGMTKRGDQAIEMAGQLQPQLILMDIRLQGALDGIEAADQICSRCDARIIYLTALLDPDTRRRADQTGPLGYIAKPFDDETLESAIENALAG